MEEQNSRNSSINKRKSIKGINNKINGTIKEKYQKERIWDLRKKTRKDNSIGETVKILPSNSYVMDKEKGEGFVYFEGLPEEKENENMEIVAAYYFKERVKENTDKKQKEAEAYKKQKEADKDNENDRKKKLRIIPIVICLGLGTLSLKGCSAEKTYVEKKVTPIEITVYQTENPSTYSWGLEGQDSQERMYNRDNSGQEGYYSSDETFTNEKNASKRSNEYKKLQEEVKKGSQDLKENMNNKQIINEMEKNVETMSEIYEEKTESVDKHLEGFKENTNVYPDSNTNIEKENAENMSENFYENKELVEENVKEMKNLKNKSNQGEIVVENVKIEKDGDIKITGEQITTLVKKEKITGIRAAIQNMKEFFKNLVKGKDDDQR